MLPVGRDVAVGTPIVGVGVGVSVGVGASVGQTGQVAVGSKPLYAARQFHSPERLAAH